MTRQNAVNSEEARLLMADANKVAAKGMQNMRGLNEAVEKIKNSSDSTARIVKTIEEIAFQTNPSVFLRRQREFYAPREGFANSVQLGGNTVRCLIQSFSHIRHGGFGHIPLAHKLGLRWA